MTCPPEPPEDSPWEAFSAARVVLYRRTYDTYDDDEKRCDAPASVLLTSNYFGGQDRHTVEVIDIDGKQATVYSGLGARHRASRIVAEIIDGTTTLRLTPVDANYAEFEP